MGVFNMKNKIIYPLIFCLFLSLILLLNGCSLLKEPERYYLNNIEIEKPNLRGDIVPSDTTKIYFDVINSGEITLLSKIEVELNESCFNRVSSKELPQIITGYKRTFIDISVRNYGYPYGDSTIKECIGKKFKVKLILKDINSEKSLDEKTLDISIV